MKPNTTSGMGCLVGDQHESPGRRVLVATDRSASERRFLGLAPAPLGLAGGNLGFLKGRDNVGRDTAAVAHLEPVRTGPLTDSLGLLPVSSRTSGGLRRGSAPLDPTAGTPSSRNKISDGVA